MSWKVHTDYRLSCHQQRALTPMFSLFTCKSGGGGCHGSHPKTQPLATWSRWPRDQDETVELRRPPSAGHACVIVRPFPTSCFIADAILCGIKPTELYASAREYLILGVDAIERIRENCVIGIRARSKYRWVWCMGPETRNRPDFISLEQRKWFMFPHYFTLLYAVE